MELDKLASPTVAPDAVAPPAADDDANAMLALLRVRPFRNLWIASAVSQMGDVCFVVALPWLVLQMTGSTVALGTILTALALPRALLLLVGGAISDRFPARTVLALAFFVQALCVGAAAFLIWQGTLGFELLVAVAFCFGIADAFTAPAMHVLLPSLVKPEQLPSANALLESTNQLCLLTGAAVVGLMIARWGVLFAFVVDAISYLCIIAVLLTLSATARAEPSGQSMRQAIAEGLRYVLGEPALRALLITIACVNFCVGGVTQVGLAALASVKFDSPEVFGFLLTSAGVGTIAGLAWGGTRAKLDSVVGVVTVSCIALSFVLAGLALDLPVWWAYGLAFALGVIAGFVNVQVLSWLQASVKSEILGRVMSVVELASAGVLPLSVALAGFLAARHVDVLFLSGGAALLAATLLTWVTSTRRK